jgi:hypothetical protein
VNVFNTLYANRDITRQTFPDREVMRKMTNQFIYGSFNKNFDEPLFTNFMDGTNGWFRLVQAPYAQSPTAMSGGWATWRPFNPDVDRVMEALNRLVIGKQKSDAAISDFVTKYYAPPAHTSDTAATVFDKNNSKELILFYSAWASTFYQ